MTDTHNAAILNEDAFNEGLRKWAKGRLPYMAGADLLITTGIGYQIRGMFDTNLDTVWPSWDSLTDAATNGGVWSGGERAIVRLALSMFQGELDDTFWRLDPTNQAAFLAALQVGMKGQEYASPRTDPDLVPEADGLPSPAARRIAEQADFQKKADKETGAFHLYIEDYDHLGNYIQEGIDLALAVKR